MSKIILKTPEEIALWSRVYAAVMGCSMPSCTARTAEREADDAVQHFRERLPKEPLADEVDRLEKMAFKKVHAI